MKKLISERKQDAINFLSDYDDEVIEYIQEYLYESTHLTVMEWQYDDFVEVSNERELYALRLHYLEFGFDEGLFESEEEFDQLCKAVEIAEGK